MITMSNMTKEEVLDLIKDKEKMEDELKTWLEVLDCQDNVGMEGELIDSEGYPRNDIDVHKVREARNKIIYLRYMMPWLHTKTNDNLSTFCLHFVYILSTFCLQFVFNLS